MAFDPCREWLGIAAVDLTDPCRVLGLAAGRHRAEAIERATVKRLATLREIVPGPFAKAHAALVSRVEAARDELLADALPSAPPAAFEQPAATPIPVLAGPWAKEDEPTVPDSDQPAGHEAPATDDGAVIHEPDSPFTVRTRRRSLHRTHQPAGGGLLLASIGLLGFAVAVLVYLVFGTRPPSGVDVVNVEVVTPRVPPATTIDRQDGVRADVNASARRPSPNPPRRDSDPPTSEASVQTPAAETPDQRLEAERTRLAKAFDEAIRETYAALKDHRFAVADRAITRADQHVGDDLEAARRLERWRLLATYARQFVDFREQAFAAANAGREFEAGGVRFSIIEITPDLFISKSEGEIRRVPRADVDPMIEMAVIGTWFERDGRAANHLFLGAGWLCRERPNLRRARAEWQTAGDGGENVRPLLALLDDPAVRPSAR